MRSCLIWPGREGFEDKGSGVGDGAGAEGDNGVAGTGGADEGV